MSGPNVFGSEWEVTHGGVGLSSITKAGGAELLGATVYIMSEPPFTEGLHDPDGHGRLLRVFERNEGRPVPPDS